MLCEPPNERQANMGKTLTHNPPSMWIVWVENMVKFSLKLQKELRGKTQPQNSEGDLVRGPRCPEPTKNPGACWITDIKLSSRRGKFLTLGPLTRDFPLQCVCHRNRYQYNRVDYNKYYGSDRSARDFQSHFFGIAFQSYRMML